METGPHPLAERVVARLLPPPCREHVLGDPTSVTPPPGDTCGTPCAACRLPCGAGAPDDIAGLACLQGGAVWGGFLSAYGHVAPSVLQTTDGVLGTLTPALTAVVVLALRDAWTGAPADQHPRARRRAAVRGHRLRCACGGPGISHALARRLDGHDGGRRGESAAPFARPCVPRPGEHSDPVRSVRRLRYAGPSLRWLVQPRVGALAVGVGAAGRSGGLGASYFSPPVYRAAASVLFLPSEAPQRLMPIDLRPHLGERLNVVSMQVLSSTRLERIVRDFNLYERERQVTEDAITRMRQDISLNIVASGERGTWFTVAYHAADPKIAMRVAERLASLFVQENLEDARAIVRPGRPGVAVAARGNGRAAGRCLGRARPGAARCRGLPAGGYVGRRAPGGSRPVPVALRGHPGLSHGPDHGAIQSANSSASSSRRGSPNARSSPYGCCGAAWARPLASSWRA